MRYASSIRYGGQLIEAIECDYEDYKYLGLLCPECKEPVFLRGEGKRMQNGKEVAIGAHFCHFKTKDPVLAVQCESRVAKYDAREIERCAARARGQRVKLLQRWFWSVFQSHPKTDNLEANIKMVNECISKGWLPQSLPSYIAELFRVNRSFLSVFAQDCFEDFSNHDWSNLDKKHYEILPEIASHWMQEDINSVYVSCDAQNQKWKNFARTAYTKLDTSLQKLIIGEVINWLCCNSSSSILEEVCKFGIAGAYGKPIEEGTLIRRRDVMTGLKLLTPSEEKLKAAFYVCQSISSDIASIPWADEFAKLEKAPIAAAS